MKIKIRKDNLLFYLAPFTPIPLNKIQCNQLPSEDTKLENFAWFHLIWMYIQLFCEGQRGFVNIKEHSGFMLQKTDNTNELSSILTMKQGGGISMSSSGRTWKLRCTLDGEILEVNTDQS